MTVFTSSERRGALLRLGLRQAVYVFVLLTCPAAAWADNPRHIGETKVVRINSGWGGEAIYITIDKQADAGCASPSVVLLEKANPGYKENLAMLITAAATKQPVEIYYDGRLCINGAARFVLMGLK